MKILRARGGQDKEAGNDAKINKRDSSVGSSQPKPARPPACLPVCLSAREAQQQHQLDFFQYE